MCTSPNFLSGMDLPKRAPSNEGVHGQTVSIGDVDPMQKWPTLQY